MTFHMRRQSMMRIIFRGRGSYVANDICESACSRSPKKCGEELGRSIVAYVWVQGEWKGESMTEDTL